jgi:predicted nucleic-acid-binding protein
MIGLDTNLLILHFAQDDSAQSHMASVMVESLTAERGL